MVIKSPYINTQSIFSSIIPAFNGVSDIVIICQNRQLYCAIAMVLLKSFFDSSMIYLSITWSESVFVDIIQWSDQ